MDHKEMILIVDDEAMNIKIAERMLGNNYDIMSVTSGKEALDFLDNKIPDLVLLDINMPEYDGFYVLGEIRKRFGNMEIPVVFLTADTDKDTEIRGFKMGAADFITKPFIPEILTERVKRTLEYFSLKKRLQNEVKEQTAKVEEGLKLLEKTERDTLTGLLMRNAGERTIAEAMSKYPGVLMFFDVDNLKKINDTIGHKAGDKVLRLMGSVLNDTVEECGSQGYACRLGGDEFLAFVQNDDLNFVIELTNRVINTFMSEKDKDVAIKEASLSAGLCESTTEDRFADVYSKADKALYHVKQNGKAGYYLYKESSQENVGAREADFGKIINAVKNSGSYDGAMDVELREFSKIFEYLKKFSARYNHELNIILLTLDKPENELIYIDEIEEAMEVMDYAINSTIRNVDVCTRYSSLQYLVVMVDAGDDNIELVIERILMKFKEKYKGDDRIRPGYNIEKVNVGN
ncbi:MAG: diguanylate cyclase [Eubacterium sp.]|nr:diguanylate cyclase [Eubacterium sp.]